MEITFITEMRKPEVGYGNGPMTESLQREPEFNKLLHFAVKRAASELYLYPGLPPMMCVDRVTREFDMRPLSAEVIETLQ